MALTSYMVFIDCFTIIRLHINNGEIRVIIDIFCITPSWRIDF